jgi:hypothetical protein
MFRAHKLVIPIAAVVLVSTACTYERSESMPTTVIPVDESIRADVYSDSGTELKVLSPLSVQPFGAVPGMQHITNNDDDGARELRLE